ncbi:MAG: hypothetical protein ACE5EH_00665 [Gammaproteobacteria bacterium]
MSSAPHLLVAISSHGFGHIAQTAPIVNEVASRIKNLKITIRSAAPLQQLESRIKVPFDYLQDEVDFGMRMFNALDVDVQATVSIYDSLHQNWGEAIKRETGLMQSIRPDLVLANIPYLTLAGAAKANIPCIAFGSLNWHDIFSHYCSSDTRSASILQQIRSAYSSATRFLSLEPTMPMSLDNRLEPIGPVAQLGNNIKKDIISLINGTAKDKLILVSLGGIATDPPVKKWPVLENFRWLVPQSWCSGQQHTHSIDALKFSFIDLLKSSDVLITKTGYGSLIEACCNQTAVINIPRPDWPEQPGLATWMEKHHHYLEAQREEVFDENIVSKLDYLNQMIAKPVISPTGIQDATDIVCSYLD